MTSSSMFLPYFSLVEGWRVMTFVLFPSFLFDGGVGESDILFQLSQSSQ